MFATPLVRASSVKLNKKLGKVARKSLILIFSAV
jgi:hypothetical protein|tara:strand:- start:361 stop:462 length:102 start_codon:yes stop_codon:yes gene_type:complete